MRAFSSAFAALALFTAAAQAGKRGLTWPWFNSPLDPGVFNNGDGQVVAIYDYETYAPPSTNGNGGLGFIGMQRCLDCDSSPISQLAARQQQQGWATVFSLNEPDINGISPTQAASWYKQYINPLAIKKALPAITSSQSSGQGLDWLQQMVNACGGGCYFDYINLHWYGSSFGEFQSYVEQAHATFPSYQIVITEFALENPSGGQAAQVDFFKQAFAYLDSQSFVQLYFPFVATSPTLLQQYDSAAASLVGTGSCLYTNDGQPSAVGNLMY
ncbi:hypothetical protein GSI_08940 [Ganoderma sinense ZZ0214-1]|uniref:Asl1-like glycosyl hydrolase catalytic domain-containing protein n=1 Tax=Ganoderma sinense ZZ0214-1 TaxID=1077348 RepID=A0A2G8S591_9APHY|nr:hypothetical protein GSI_08940 [Ganoderma sinense ZZ0214-1]